MGCQSSNISWGVPDIPDSFDKQYMLGLSLRIKKNQAGVPPRSGGLNMRMQAKHVTKHCYC